MNARVSFQNAMAYATASHLPLMRIDPYESLTVARWRQQGLPQDVDPDVYLGLAIPPAFCVNLGPVPAFSCQRIAEDETSFTETDGMGCTIRRSREAPAMYYGLIDHPVKNRDDWTRYKERLEPASPDRYWPDVERIVAAVNSSDTPVGLLLYPWFFRYGFYLMGMERFLTGFYDTPDLMHDIFAHISQMTLQLIRPLISRGHFDYAGYAEDLAYRNGPHISPEIYRDFWLPHQDPITQAMQQAGIPVIGLYSSGNCEALLPLAMEHGINGFWPCERASGMDPILLRRKFGRDLRLMGGIAHACLSQSQSAIDAEVNRLRPLVEEGGFVPAIDDMVPPEVPFENYRYGIERLRALVRSING
jgi:hypothetical protein